MKIRELISRKSFFCFILAILFSITVLNPLSAATWRIPNGRTYHGGNSTTYNLVKGVTWYSGVEMLAVEVYEVAGAPNMLSYDFVIHHPKVKMENTGSHVNITYQPNIITTSSVTKHYFRNTVNLIHENS